MFFSSYVEFQIFIMLFLMFKKGKMLRLFSCTLTFNR